ncbi:hypothetical protein FRC02_002173 [Tulasnella sp. 418]|nr:hypothetical protein FRC02_002173 [Tulasnella sp. 418]
MALNYSYPTPSPKHSLEEDRRKHKVGRRPQRREMTDSPTFHIDPARSSSSDNGSLASPFSFPNQPPFSNFQGARDSFTTHDSSLYPASTSSYSANSPPEPSSPSSASFSSSLHTRTTETESMDPHQFLDPDDMSYRLQLLVRNTYFLPPAHSKPSQSELSLLAAESAHHVPPSKSPTFMDFFRGSKSRSSSRSPNANISSNNRSAPSPPPLRQVKSHGALGPRKLVPPPSDTSSSSQGLSQAAAERRGRVVVIREKVEDLAVAAQEAQVQMRVQQQQQQAAQLSAPRRSDDRRRTKSYSSRRSERIEDVIDPTDAVDLPSYQFQPQPSAIHGLGLGVDASGLSAAVLADQLPPPGSPETSKEDLRWRKALLHQAVGLSMMSIPSPTPTSTTQSSPASSKLQKPNPSKATTSSPLTGPPAKPAISQPIIEGITFAVRSSDASEKEPPKKERPNPSTSMEKPQPIARTPNRASPHPQRSETPLAPSQPLQPPPHRRRAGSSAPRPSMEPPIPQSPYQPESIHPLDDESDDEHQSQHRPLDAVRNPISRSASPLFPDVVGNNGDTIRKTLTRPLLSEGYDSERTGRSGRTGLTGKSSDYFTPYEAPLDSPTLVIQDPDGGRQKLPPSTTMQTMTSGSHYSDDEPEVVTHSIHVNTRAEEDDTFTRPPRPSFAMSSDHGARHSGDSGQTSTRPSNDSHLGVGRTSIAESHTSHITSTFGRYSSSSRRSPLPHQHRNTPSPAPSSRAGSVARDDEFVQPPPPLPAAVIPSVGSEHGFHSLGGVGNYQPPALQPRPSSANRAATAPTLASRRSQNLEPLILTTSSLAIPPNANKGGLRSAPAAPEGMGGIDFFDNLQTQAHTPTMRGAAGGWRTGGTGTEESMNFWDSEDEDEEEEVAPPPRARVHSTATITPNTYTPSLSAQSSNLRGRPMTSATTAHFPHPNAAKSQPSSPYLMPPSKPFGDLDPTMPLTNTPPSTQGGFLMSTLSTISSSLGSFGADGNKKGEGSSKSPMAKTPITGLWGVKKNKVPDSTYDLMRYAKDPKARSTPTLSPSKNTFFEEPLPPGRKSNVSALGIERPYGGREERGGKDFVSSWRKQQLSQNPEVRKLDGLLTQHMEREKDMIKKMARNLAG